MDARSALDGVRAGTLETSAPFSVVVDGGQPLHVERFSSVSLDEPDLLTMVPAPVLLTDPVPFSVVADGCRPQHWFLDELVLRRNAGCSGSACFENNKN